MCIHSDKVFIYQYVDENFKFSNFYIIPWIQIFCSRTKDHGIICELLLETEQTSLANIFQASRVVGFIIILKLRFIWYTRLGNNCFVMKEMYKCVSQILDTCVLYTCVCAWIFGLQKIKKKKSVVANGIKCHLIYTCIFWAEKNVAHFCSNRKKLINLLEAVNLWAKFQILDDRR